MKKLIFLLSFLLLNAVSFSQTPIDLGNNGTVWNDSLYFGTPGDSIYTIDLNMEYEWVKIFLEGDANSPVDSIAVYNGSNLYGNASGKPNGNTLYGTVFATIVNTATGKETTLTQPPMQLLKIALVNHRATLATRNITFIIQAKKKAK